MEGGTVAFLTQTNQVLAKYIGRFQAPHHDNEEIREALMNFLRYIMNAKEEFWTLVTTALASSFRPLVSNLIDFIIQQYHVTVLESVPLDLKAPLMLAYYSLELFSSNKLVDLLSENSIVHSCIHQLRGLQIFLSFNKTLATISASLLNVLCDCCVYSPDDICKQAVQYSLHHVLVYYSKLQFVNIALLAKATLAILCDKEKLGEFYRGFTQLGQHEFLNMVRSLKTCLQTDQMECNIIDLKGGPSCTYSASDLLTYLFYLAKYPKNYPLMSDTEFLKLLHTLLRIELAELQCAVVRLLSVIATHQMCASKICTEVPDILLMLEDLTLDEATIVSLVAPTAEAILINANVSTVVEEVEFSEVHFKDAESLLKTFVQSIRQFLQGITYGNISSVFKNIELRNQIGLLMSILRMMSEMSVKQSDSIASFCSAELKDFSSTLRDYTGWMFTGHLKSKGENLLSIPPTHPLALFHVVLHEMSNASQHTRKILIDSGLFTLMIHEVESLIYLENQQKGVSWFMHICLATIMNCYLNTNKEIFQNEMKHEIFGPLCIAEEFDYRLPAKIITSFSNCSNDHLKLTELLDSEVRVLLNGLKQSVAEKICFISPIVSRISFTFYQLLEVIDRLLECNPCSCQTVLKSNQSLSILHEQLSSNCTDALAKEKLVAVTSRLLSHSSKSLQTTDVISTFPEMAAPAAAAIDSSELVSKKGQAEYWMSCITDSERTIMTKRNDDLIEDGLQECFQEAKSINFDMAVAGDRLTSEILQLLSVMLSQDGQDAFLSLAKELPTFCSILASFIEFSCSRLIKGIEVLKVPSTTLVRLEHLLSLLNYACQSSEHFCLLLGETGVIQSLDDMLLTFNTFELYYGLPKLMWQLTDLAACIIAVCGCVEPFQGYLSHLVSTNSLMSINRTKTKLLAKCILLNHHHTGSISDGKVNLTGPEVDILFDLIQSAIESENGTASIWPMYTIVCTHSLQFLFKMCICFLKAPMNLDIFVRKGILTLLNLALQLHCSSTTLRALLCFLELLAQKQSIRDEVTKSHKELIANVKAIQNNYSEDIFFCLRSLGNKIDNNTGHPEFLLEAIAHMRCKHFDVVITSIENLLKESTDKTAKPCLMKMLGDAAYQNYQTRRLVATDKSERFSCLEDAKTAVSCIGYALDEGILEESLSTKLDVAMMDLIFNIPEKPLQRCLLCRKKCRGGEKLIRSHIWPESLLRAFMDSKNIPESLKIFDASWKQFGYLQGPGQLAFYMLCKSCENVFSLLEKWFKSKFYGVVHNDSQSPSLSTTEECHINFSDSKANQLYLFCLSFIFRVTFLASNGFINRYGNADQIYCLFNSCRKLLLSNGDVSKIDTSPPRVAIFLTPVHYMSKMNFSPSFMKVIFSMGTGNLPSFRLHDGAALPKGHVDYLLCSIADINIIAFISENSLKFVPKECLLEITSSNFTVPSALKRFLLFPKGLFKEFEALASSQMSRALRVPSNRLTAKSNISWASEEKELYMNALTFPSEKDVYINFLPPLFSHVKQVGGFCNVLKSSAKMKMICHLFDFKGTIGHFFIIKVMISENSFEVHAFLNFQEKGCNVWIGYKLSVIDLSVNESLQFSKEKTEFFLEIEKMFDTKSRIISLTNNALKKAGFCHKSHFVHLLKYRTQIMFDVKCSVPCSYCLDVCSICCMSGTSITVKIDGSVPVASVCSKQCADYVTSSVGSNVSEGVKNVHVNRSNSEFDDLLLSFSINGIEFGFDNSMLLVHLFKDSSKWLLACFQIRRPYHQRVVLMKVSSEFDSIELMDENDAELVQKPLQQELLIKMKKVYKFS